jgi:hypothetical protein
MQRLWDPLVASFLVIIWSLLFGLVFGVFCSCFVILCPNKPLNLSWKTLGENPQADHLGVTSLDPYEPWSEMEQSSFHCETCRCAGRLLPPKEHPSLVNRSFCPLFCHVCDPRLGYIMCAYFCLNVILCWSVGLSCGFALLVKTILITTIWIPNFGLVIYFVKWRPCFAWGYWGWQIKRGYLVRRSPSPVTLYHFIL